MTMNVHIYIYIYPYKPMCAHVLYIYTHTLSWYSHSAKMPPFDKTGRWFSSSDRVPLIPTSIVDPAVTWHTTPGHQAAAGNAEWLAKGSSWHGSLKWSPLIYSFRWMASLFYIFLCLCAFFSIWIAMWLLWSSKRHQISSHMMTLFEPNVPRVVFCCGETGKPMSFIAGGKIRPILLEGPTNLWLGTWELGFVICFSTQPRQSKYLA